MTRDFIAKSLYNQDTGYFSTKDVINDLPGPLEFGSMMGELHYRLDVKKVIPVSALRVCVCVCVFPTTETKSVSTYPVSRNGSCCLLSAATQGDVTHADKKAKGSFAQ